MPPSSSASSGKGGRRSSKAAKKRRDAFPPGSGVLLAFGVGFSYQLGLEEPRNSTGSSSSSGSKSGGEKEATVGQTRGVGDSSLGRRPRTGGGPGGRPGSGGGGGGGGGGSGSGGSRASGSSGEVGDVAAPIEREPRICSSVQSIPKAVALDRFVKKGDSPAFAAAGANHSVLLTSEGKLFRWGVEDGDIYPFPTGVCTQIPLPCVEVCCGRKHTMALMKGGFVMTWGTGYFGQLGHGDNASYRHPRLLRRLDPQRLGERVVQVACGGYHSAVATDAGRVFGWGFNRYGQCGNGSKDNTVPEPALVDLSNLSSRGAAEVPNVVCGRHHSALVTSGGSLYSWGACSFGKLGLQDPEKTVCIPREVTFFSDKPILQAAAGDFHMVALSRKREVYSWGYGAEGQGGHGSLLHMRMPRRVTSLQEVPVAQVACGPWWSMAVTTDGYCYAWGSADGGWTGLERPPGLSIVDPGQTNGDRAVETQSFDSTHNVHVPALVYSLAPYKVRQIGCGGGHTLVVAERRTRPTSPGVDGCIPFSAGGVPSAAKGGSGGGGCGSGAAARSTGVESSSSSPSSGVTRSSSPTNTTATLSSVSSVSSHVSLPASRRASLPAGGKAWVQAQVAQEAAAAPAVKKAAAALAVGGAAVEAGKAGSRQRLVGSPAPARTMSMSMSESGRDSGATGEASPAGAVEPKRGQEKKGRAGQGSGPSSEVPATAANGSPPKQAAAESAGRGTRQSMGSPLSAFLSGKHARRPRTVSPSPSSFRIGTRKAGRKGSGAKNSGGSNDDDRASSSSPPPPLVVVAGTPGGEYSTPPPSFEVASGEGGGGGRSLQSPPAVTGRSRRFLCNKFGRDRKGDGDVLVSVGKGRKGAFSMTSGWGAKKNEAAAAAAAAAAPVAAPAPAPAPALAPEVVEGGDRSRRRRPGKNGARGCHSDGGAGDAGVAEQRGREEGGEVVRNGALKESGGVKDEEEVAKVFSYCRHGRVEQVQEALKAGFDVCNRRDENGNTLLHCAAQNGLRRMCKSVLQKGKGQPVNLKNNRGNTALHYAFAFGFHQLGKYLTSNGADDTLLNDQGLTCYEGLDREDLE